jgi:hypothetical protein
VAQRGSETTSIPVLEAHNVELVAHHPMGKRPGFKMAMQEVDGTWYLYVGHLWHSGWSIFDVTDPYDPRLVNFVEGPGGNTWTLQVQVAEGKLVAAYERIGTYLDPGRAAMWGYTPGLPNEEGVAIFDVATDPVDPKLLGRFETKAMGTHRNYYDGGSYMHLAANMEGFRSNIWVCVDISDPSSPKEVSRWSLEGQDERDPTGGAKGSHHGPAYIEGDRAYLAYGRSGAFIMDVSDMTSPRQIGHFDIGSFGSLIGAHTFLPIPDRNIAILTTEAILENGKDSANFVTIIDIADETKPRAMSFLPTPVPSAQAPFDSYVARGGKFGPHNIPIWNHQSCLKEVKNLLPLCYFSAGLRMYDISDPYMPKEVGYFVPGDPEERLSRPHLPTNLIPQYEDVLWDARGYMYVSDKNYGLTILKYTGPALD